MWWKAKLLLWIANKCGVDERAAKFILFGSIALLAIIALTAVYQVKLYNSYQDGIKACEANNAKQETIVVEKVRYVKQKVDAMHTGAVYDGLQSWTR